MKRWKWAVIAMESGWSGSGGADGDVGLVSAKWMVMQWRRQTVQIPRIANWSGSVASPGGNCFWANQSKEK